MCILYTYVEIAGIEKLQTGMQLLYKSLLHLPQFFVDPWLKMSRACQQQTWRKKNEKGSGVRFSRIQKIASIFNELRSWHRQGLAGFRAALLQFGVSRRKIGRCGFLGNMTPIVISGEVCKSRC